MGQHTAKIGASLRQHRANIGPWHCRRPSVANRRLHRLAAPAADPPPTHDYRCNLQCILRVVFKKHRFLQGFVAFAVWPRISILATLKNDGFFMVLGVRRGSGTETLAS